MVVRFGPAGSAAVPAASSSPVRGPYGSRRRRDEPGGRDGRAPTRRDCEVVSLRTPLVSLGAPLPAAQASSASPGSSEGGGGVSSTAIRRRMLSAETPS